LASWIAVIRDGDDSILPPSRALDLDEMQQIVVAVCGRIQCQCAALPHIPRGKGGVAGQRAHQTMLSAITPPAQQTPEPKPAPQISREDSVIGRLQQITVLHATLPSIPFTAAGKVRPLLNGTLPL
jgi:hypothetical protein